ncbi:MAG: hypothetical protein ABI238_01545 [Terrimesophilobacter sp.]
MTITAPINVLAPQELSTAARASTASHGIDRAVERLAVALLSWSRTRAARTALDHSEHSLRLQQRNQKLQREAGALRLTQRIGL